ncbi:hypothetical protein DACRYDRAFT_47116 [Dacryopinax primogenitus]|uniref:dolichol kinase n=1 Tax=Dacryopinax primogenitus (strain DJM 731) TaxID=1858805 RepID=M5GDR8_DACPD|nr:uncharacterized protein DACRYDRAFT_47116 [Dacryopinax primogenitus]EJU04762.1 hypothetical protein DACRYDRAFT_47116 [Dacryopinax primogenitus]
MNSLLPKLNDIHTLRERRTPPNGRRASFHVSAQQQLKPELEKDGDIGRLWMTEERDYRDCIDSGIITALLLGPLVSASALLVSLPAAEFGSPLSSLSPRWLVEPPLASSTIPPTVALVRSRRNMFEMASLCSFLISIHFESSRRADIRVAKEREGGVRSGLLPKSELRRFGSYVGMTVIMVSIAVGVKTAATSTGSSLWSELSMFDVLTVSLFYQFCLYVMIRLARRGFTLGELCFVAQCATALVMETTNLTISRIWPISTPFIKTFRRPTPLLIYQLALIPGCLLAGFLLSPLLVLSRNIAQKPLHRLRFPEDKLIQRRGLAAAVYAGFALFIGGVVGVWTQWCLGWRNPWAWVVFWLLEGRRPWSRLVLLGYWGILGSLSVAGWNRQLARQRRYRHLNGHGAGHNAPARTGNGTLTQDGHVSESAIQSPVGTASSSVTEMLDAADKHVPTLGLNARRKFFHALAVLMFLPGIIIDPAFTHLSFSAAFALFTFAEYVRYFALYPFGAAVHVFLSEFLDHRDSGTAILSHFYLLTGCAGSIWLEDSKPILELTGVLVLGVGDALASIIGRKIGKHRWSSASGKSVEGSAALAGSVWLCALLLRLSGIVDPFSLWKYGCAIGLGSLLEALSMQNDNLVLPLYVWCLLALFDV